MLKSHEILENDRHDALAVFAKMGLPNRKKEAFHFTDLSRLEKRDFAPAMTGCGDLPAALTTEPIARIVVFNGRLRLDLSDVKSLENQGVVLRSLDEIIEVEPVLLLPHIGKIVAMAERPLLADNNGHFRDGVYLHFAENVKIDGVIEILYRGEGADVKLQPRALILMDEGAEATILEHHVSHDNIWANGVTELRIADKAKLKHYRLQEEDLSAVHTHLLAAVVGAEASYDVFTLTLGAVLSRCELYAKLEGEGAKVHLNGAYLIKDKQLCDTTSVIDHAVPHGTSLQTYRGVIDDKARGVFQGRINVWRDAQKTDGYQLNQALLLSDKAEIDCKPELEIFADDVVCSHGATAGQLDDKALFYMRSRGISEKEARVMLIGAFIKQSLEDVAVEEIATLFEGRIEAWLKAQVEV